MKKVIYNKIIVLKCKINKINKNLFLFIFVLFNIFRKVFFDLNFYKNY
jgi:hypothetical protein